jgi:hypothetical protein
MHAVVRWNYVQYRKASYGPAVMLANRPTFSGYVQFLRGQRFCSISSSMVESAWNLNCGVTTNKAWYRVVKKFLCTRRLRYRKLQVMFKVSPASLQTFIDKPNCVLQDRVQYTTVHIPNAFCDGQWLKLFKIFLHVFLYCNHQVHRDFLSHCIMFGM